MIPPCVVRAHRGMRHRRIFQSEKPVNLSPAPNFPNAATIPAVGASLPPSRPQQLLHLPRQILARVRLGKLSVLVEEPHLGIDRIENRRPKALFHAYYVPSSD